MHLLIMLSNACEKAYEHNSYQVCSLPNTGGDPLPWLIGGIAGVVLLLIGLVLADR